MAAEQPRANPTGRRVTITAIARAAGVSVPTVSRVVNGRSDVSPQTRERVEELLRLHGYRGRPARPRASGLIDLVLNELDSPWALEIIRGVEEVAHGAGVGHGGLDRAPAGRRDLALAADHPYPRHRRRDPGDHRPGYPGR